MNALKTTISAMLMSAASAATANPTFDFNASPYNYQNSEFNYDNSPYNYRNSPYNYQNNPLNLRSTNGIYNNEGHRIGYEVQSPSGVTNFFDKDGNQIGYQPAKRR